MAMYMFMHSQTFAHTAVQLGMLYSVFGLTWSIVGRMVVPESKECWSGFRCWWFGG